MPHRYQGHRIPAVLYANTFDYVVGFVCIIAGLRIVFEPSAAPVSIDNLPDLLNVAYRGILIIGGILILVGLTKRYTTRWGTSFERSGMWFAGTAFITYATAAITSPETRQSSFIAILIILAFAVGCGIRALGLGIEARNEARAIIETLQESQYLKGRGDE